MICSPLAKLNSIFRALQIAMLLFVSIFSSVYANTSTAKEFLHIKDIHIEGNKLISESEIRAQIKTKPGDKFDRVQIMEDLKAINEMGYFDDKSLQVTPNRDPGNLVGLKFTVCENETVKGILVSGNKLISTEEILLVFKDQVGKPHNLNQLSASVDKIEQIYHDKGFILARVTDVKDFPDGSVKLTINEGTIEKIDILGNSLDSAYIRKNLCLKTGDVYDENKLTVQMRKIYARGNLADIRRSLEPSASEPEKYVLKIEVLSKNATKLDKEKFELPKIKPNNSGIRFWAQFSKNQFHRGFINIEPQEKFENPEIPQHLSDMHKKIMLPRDLPLLNHFLIK